MFGYRIVMATDRPAVLHRRARLRELILERFGDRQVDFIAHVAQMTSPQRHLNQGMISQLMRDNSGKAFGEKMAQTLARDAGLPDHYFDLPLGSLLDLPFGAGAEEPAPPPYDPHSAQILRMLADDHHLAKTRIDAANCRMSKNFTVWY